MRDIEAQKRVQVADAHRPKVGHSIHRSLAEIPDPADHGVFEIQPADSKTPAS